MGWKGPKIPRDFTSLAISTNFIFKVIGGRSNIKAVAAEKKINIITVKSLSETLLFAEHGRGENMLCTGCKSQIRKMVEFKTWKEPEMVETKWL